MITNDRQYKIVKSQIESFQNSLAELSSNQLNFKDVHPDLIAFQKKAIVVKLQELLGEAEEYEALKDGKIVITQVNDLSELPLMLIKARIAHGLTQAELADKLGVKMQQVQRYESEKYETASLKTLINVAEVLKIKINADVQIKEVGKPGDFDMKNYPFRQMFKRGWFGNFCGSFNDAVLNSADLLEKLFEGAGITNLSQSLTKKSIRIGSEFNSFALKAWYAQVIAKARQQLIISEYNNDVINEEWLRNLAKLSVNENGPLLAVEYLNNSGIRIIIEPQLDGTFLDGAALLLDNIYPVVALTIRHDRLDNFWFVLFHELAHIKLHLSNTLNIIFDDLDMDIDGIEKEADEFALNALIPNEVWRKSLARFNPTPQTISLQAKRLEINQALVAGRIRRETKRYYEFTDLVGQGEVRKNFHNDFNN